MRNAQGALQRRKMLCTLSRRRQLVNVLAVSLWLVFAVRVAMGAEPLETYQTQIKPLLRTRCFSCHGGLKQEADLRLDTGRMMVDGGAITPGDVDDSPLITRVSATNAAERMPPEHEGEALSQQQVQTIATWIAAGAPVPPDERPETDPDAHWSFQSVTRPTVPAELAKSSWVRNPIDAFIANAHQQHGLQAQTEASRAILLRRLYLDLIGIPPSPDEIASFENDSASDWYEKTVNRLLDDPRHGERWARHWMDIWRYSDWWGLGDQLRNSQQHMWHWRDWIVESLNVDRGYDEMVRLMLAGDELQPNDPHALAATGLLARNYFLFNRNQWMEETVEHVGKAFLGLTFNCAKCHDHKFDPISHTDYYRLRAYFEPYQVRMDMLPGEVDLTKDGVPRAFDAQLDAPTYRLIRGEEGNLDRSQLIEPGVPKFLDFECEQPDVLHIHEVVLPDQAWQPSRRPWVYDNYFTAASNKQKTAEMRLEQAQTAANQSSKDNGDSNVGTDTSLKLANLDVEIARAELESIERRYDAMQAEWGPPSEVQADRAAVATAIQAERRVAVLIAQRGLIAVQARLSSAAADQRAAIEKEQTQAQQALEKAEQALAAEIAADESFTPLIGATWSATRFQSTTKDDPTIEFSPRSTGRRSALARWITDRRHPLTARVAVNHLWTRHLGEPLVASVFDLGRNGASPTNAAVLDWLAAELLEHDWSMKHIHRLIVTSALYRMSSSNRGAAANEEIDPDDRFWWRRQPIRLESQVVRDAMLALAGTLDPTMGGPPVPVGMQENSTRRSLYFFHSNNQRDLFLTMFDEALVTDCYRREQSIVPQQALALTNSKLVLTASEQIAQRLSNNAVDQREFISTAMKTLLGIQASNAETLACEKAMATWEQQQANTPAQARAHLIWVLLNHNDFVTVR